VHILVSQVLPQAKIDEGKYKEMLMLFLAISLIGLAAAFYGGDHLHPHIAAYRIMAEVIDLKLFKP
jgi:hypothetical protein